MSRTLTKKQRSFVKEYAKNENGTQAVIKAKYDVKDSIVAKSIATENLTKPYIIEAVKLEKQSLADSIPDELLTERHIELLNKRETFVNIVNNSKVDLGPDTQAVKAGLEMGYRLKGSYAPEKSLHLGLSLADVLDVIENGTTESNTDKLSAEVAE